MPRRKNAKPVTIDDAIDKLSAAENTLNEEMNNLFIDEKPKKVKPENAEPLNDNYEDKTEIRRDELLKLAEDGDLDKSVAYIKKASHKVINKLYTEYERKRMQKANEFLTDPLISKFANTLGGIDGIESPDELTNELKKDELLKRDIFCLVEKISPYIPFLRILSGGITTAKHIYRHKTKPQEETSEDGECNN